MLSCVEKYSKLFNVKSTVVEVANYLIVYEPTLTAVKTAELVQMIFESYGLKVKTTAGCISWYKNELRKADNTSADRIAFKKAIDDMPDKEKNKILLSLARQYTDILVKAIPANELVASQYTDILAKEAIPANELVARQYTDILVKTIPVKAIPANELVAIMTPVLVVEEESV